MTAGTASSERVTKKLRMETAKEIAEMLLPLSKGLVVDPLPEHPGIDSSFPHAPNRIHCLTSSQKELALRNALRYFPEETHGILAPEFAKELAKYGHIYMYRFRPTSYEMKAYPISCYPCKCRQAAAVMLMIMNNLDRRVAQFPHELVTYGGNGSVFQNWAQYHITMKLLSQMSENQTLSMYSGHPMGLFPSTVESPRVVITNGMVIPNYSSQAHYNDMFATGVSMYGQMTAGSYCYIGPQGIVHGTTITVLNAGRKYLNLEDLAGKVYVSSGLGGMSGAQGKASEIAGLIGVIAEVSEEALMKRHSQGWITEVARSPEECIEKIIKAREVRAKTSIGFLGNVVDLWEHLAEVADSPVGRLVDLGSDQTSLHNPFNGGYYPVQLGFEEANVMMRDDPGKFKSLVQESLKRHVNAINKLAAKGMRFWDYGNSFLLEASRAQADVLRENQEAEGGGIAFKYPSYVQDIMGDVFSLGFGPFRWVCTSLDPEDLALTDQIAAAEIRKMLNGAPPRVAQQLRDNLKWIEQAGPNELVVGSQARILYADALGRKSIALAFNNAVAAGQLKGPVVLSRDHHDVSGTDSPFRETSNITDGSHYTADMAIQNVIGDSFRGATWVAIHNGGGVGWGEVVNGGFGLVLDGSEEAAKRAANMLDWDVNNGIARRSWGRNDNARFAIQRAMQANPNLVVTVPNLTQETTVSTAIREAFQLE